MKYIEMYCSDCEEKTIHITYTEDGYGVSGVSRIVSSILSLGISNLYCDTICRCLNCGKSKRIK